MSDDACELTLLPDFFRGDTVTLELEHSTENAECERVPVDITGHVFVATLKADPADADAAAAWKVSVTAAGDDAADGIVRLIVPAEPTDPEAIPPDNNQSTTPGDYYLRVRRVISGDPDDVLTVHDQRITVLP